MSNNTGFRKQHKGGAAYSQAYPLRKIVGRHYNEVDMIIEELECGHEQRQKHDLVGPTNAYSRRCRQCYREQQSQDVAEGVEK